MTQKKLFFLHDYQTFKLRVLLSFCLIFCQFYPGVGYKGVAYIKNRVCAQINSLRNISKKSIREKWIITKFKIFRLEKITSFKVAYFEMENRHAISQVEHFQILTICWGNPSPLSPKVFLNKQNITYTAAKADKQIKPSAIVLLVIFGRGIHSWCQN